MKKLKTPGNVESAYSWKTALLDASESPRQLHNHMHTRYSCQRNAQRPGSSCTKMTCFLKGGLNCQCENTSSASALGTSITFLKGRTRVVCFFEQTAIHVLLPLQVLTTMQNPIVRDMDEPVSFRAIICLCTAALLRRRKLLKTNHSCFTAHPASLGLNWGTGYPVAKREQKWWR